MTHNEGKPQGLTLIKLKILFLGQGGRKAESRKSPKKTNNRDTGPLPLTKEEKSISVN